MKNRDLSIVGLVDQLGAVIDSFERHHDEWESEDGYAYGVMLHAYNRLTGVLKRRGELDYCDIEASDR